MNPRPTHYECAFIVQKTLYLLAQDRMGHSTLAMTADRYGHLFPSQDDAEVLATGERALMGA